MKAIKFFGFPLLFLTLFIISTPFQSCDPDDDECDTCTVAYKPNIYIYPTENIQLTVKISFPKGGKIITSIPEHGEAWNVSVDTNGLINQKYSYLFYESIQPDIWQTSYGWNISTPNLESFFRKNMYEYGFYGQEIDDFIEHWIPRLDEYKYYSIYPQTKELVNNVVKIDFSKPADNFLRLFYFIEGHNKIPKTLEEPDITKFNRENYFITEWGVILRKPLSEIRSD